MLPFLYINEKNNVGQKTSRVCANAVDERHNQDWKMFRAGVC